MGQLKRPFPPGDYPLIVVGSGPAGLQTSYFLRRYGVRHAVLSADEGPGGMFRRFPFFDRLISWTKPYAPADPSTPAYGRYDWNSLLCDDPRHRGLVRTFMDGSSYFPRRGEMEDGLAAFARRLRLRVRYGCRWDATAAAGDRFELTTSDGVYGTSLLVFAIGVAEPWSPSVPGIHHGHHYVDLRPARSYAGKRVLILGKRNSAFETANALLPWASTIFLASPSPVRFSVDARHPSAARAIYMQTYEDHILGGGHHVIDAVPERIVRTPRGLRVLLAGTTVPGAISLRVDEVVVATGFQAPLLDLPDLGVETVGQQRFPVQTPFWESAMVPGIYFAGSMTQGAAGLGKYGRPNSSGVVHGFRHNARLLAGHIAATHFGFRPPRHRVPPGQLASFLLREAALAPELWNQQSYLCRVVASDPRRGPVDAGVLPLRHFVDAPGEDAIAVAVETDPSGDTHPAIYVKRRGRVKERLLDSGSFLDFRTEDNRAQLESLTKQFLKAAAVKRAPARS